MNVDFLKECEEINPIKTESLPLDPRLAYLFGRGVGLDYAKAAVHEMKQEIDRLQQRISNVEAVINNL